jgi:hypothetical protein
MKVMLEVFELEYVDIEDNLPIGRQKECWKKWSQETLHHFNCLNSIRTLRLWTQACG